MKPLSKFSAALVLMLAIIWPAMGTAATIQVGFSPEGSARTLVLGVIEAAEQDVRMMAYSLTAADITKALVAAHKRGVDVRVVVDERESKGQYMQHALNTLVNAGVPVRTNGRYQIQHDKAIVIDGQTTQTGSFNYSRSAEEKNSENVLVVWNYPEVATSYLEHWQSRWQQGQDYQQGY